MIQDRSGNTPLHYAARHPSGTDFMALIEKDGPEALFITDIYDNTPLLIAAFQQSSIAFIALIEKLSSEALNKALLIKNLEGKTPLHVAAEFQSEKAFIALIEKVGPEALFIQDINGNTPLYLAVQLKKQSVVLAVFEKTDIETLNKILLLVPSHFSPKQKRDYFLDIIGLAQLLITNSNTLLSLKDKSVQLNKLLGCVKLRRGWGQKRAVMFWTEGGSFNEKLNGLIQKLNASIEKNNVLVDDNKPFGDGVMLKNLASNNSPKADYQDSHREHFYEQSSTIGLFPPPCLYRIGELDLDTSRSAMASKVASAE